MQIVSTNNQQLIAAQNIIISFCNANAQNGGARGICCICRPASAAIVACAGITNQRTRLVDSLSNRPLCKLVDFCKNACIGISDEPEPHKPHRQMLKFKTVKSACEFLAIKTQKHWECKFEMLHGKRFYFVWRTDSLPFDQQQNVLVCRGDKQTVLSQLERKANSPLLPQFL